MGSKRTLKRDPNKGSNGSLNKLDRRSKSHSPKRENSSSNLDKASTHTSSSKKKPLRRLSSKVIESMAEQGLDELQIAMMKFDRKQDQEERKAKERRRTKILKKTATRGLQKSASTRSLTENIGGRPTMERRRSSSTSDLLDKAKQIQDSMTQKQQNRKRSILLPKPKRASSMPHATFLDDSDSDSDSDAPMPRDSTFSKISLSSHKSKSLPLTYMKDWSDSESESDSDDDSSLDSVTSSLSGSGGTSSDKSKSNKPQHQTVVCQINGALANVQILPPKQQLAQIFGEPTWLQKESFDWQDYFTNCHQRDNEITPQLQAAIQSKQATRLQKLFQRGESMNACNPQTGESLIQMVCQRACKPQLEFLIKEAKADVRVRDNAGKTVLHELAWNPTLDPDLVMLILLQSPELLWAPDSRGFLPLDYVPKRTLVDWYALLEQKQKQIKLALEFSRWKATSQKLNATQEKLKTILQRHYAAGVL